MTTLWLRGLPSRANHAEANAAVVAVVGEVAAPGCNRTAGSVIAPAATTENAARARRRASRKCACAYAAVPVPAPFPYVAAHVVKVKAVLCLCLYRMGSVIRAACANVISIFSIPCDIAYCVAATVGSLSAVGYVATAGKVFPFCFRGQSVAVCAKVAFCCIPRCIAACWHCTPFRRVGLSAYFVAGGLAFIKAALVAVDQRVVPAYIVGGIVVSISVSGAGLASAVVAVLFVFSLRYLVVAYQKAWNGNSASCNEYIGAGYGCCSVECCTGNCHKT